MESLREKLHKLPKRDVHNHLHLGGSPALLKKRYGKRDLVIPKCYDGLSGMISFIKNKVNPFLQNEQDVYFFLEMALENALADNVHYLEASIDIGLVNYLDHGIDSLIELVSKLQHTFAKSITFRPDIGINKDYPIQKAYTDGLRCMESGLFNGLDLYGEERNKDLGPFIGLYDQAREYGLKTKVHIGEFSNHASIDDAIRRLRPDEIQHGIMAVGSSETMNRIKNQNIRLNLCPQSNISLGAVSSLKAHPIRTLYDHGIAITINTDDHLLFGSSVTDQLVELVKADIFSLSEIEGIVSMP